MQLKRTAIQRIVLTTGILSIALVSGSCFTMALVLSSPAPSYAVFFYRHPERNGTPIGSDELQAMREWTSLRNAMWVPAD